MLFAIPLSCELIKQRGELKYLDPALHMLLNRKMICSVTAGRYPCCGRIDQHSSEPMGSTAGDYSAVIGYWPYPQASPTGQQEARAWRPWAG